MCRSRSPVFRVLILFVIARPVWADSNLVGDRLMLDATIWTNGHLWRAEQADLARNEFVIERVVAPVGLTGRLGPVASLRLSGDVSSVSPMDLYAGLRWPNGFGLRVGQFVMPLGFDLMTDPAKQPLVNNSLLSGYSAPAGSRDIGLMGELQRSLFSITGAVINGDGANAASSNSRKDVCGRMTFKPLSTVDGLLALRAYYGVPEASDTCWRTVAAEARLNRGPLELQAEFQNRYSSDVRGNAAYLQAAWSIGQLQPAGRFDLVLPQGEHPEWMVTGGLNLEVISDHIKVMFDCTYRRNYQANWSIFGFLFRLQADM